LAASDVDGDILTFEIVTPPAHGVLTGVAPKLTYTPAENFVGGDSFTFRASDGRDMSELATISISVAGAALNHGVLTILGTPNRDFVVLHRLRGALVVLTAMNLPSHETDDDNCGQFDDEDWWRLLGTMGLAFFNASEVQSLVVQTFAGNDHTYISQSVAQPATIDPGEGNDWTHGGAGPDAITDLAGNNRIYAGGGNDRVVTGPGVDVIEAGAGDDHVESGDGKDVVQGDDGNDLLLGGLGNDTLWGGDDRDILIGGAGADSITGDEGDDILIAGELTDSEILAQIFADWTSTKLNYSKRVSKIKAYKPLVLDDQAVDILTGASGSDWFWLNSSDKANDKSSGEALV
jgi:Ca2+-binding RTX toxin-like protein